MTEAVLGSTCPGYGPEPSPGLEEAQQGQAYLLRGRLLWYLYCYPQENLGAPETQHSIRYLFANCPFPSLECELHEYSDFVVSQGWRTVSFSE